MLKLLLGQRRTALADCAAKGPSLEVVGAERRARWELRDLDAGDAAEIYGREISAGCAAA
jgi:hypothetical protein